MKYFFRGLEILNYNEATKLVTTKEDNFNNCKFIVEDYELLAEFFTKCYNHSRNIATDTKDIEVY